MQPATSTSTARHRTRRRRFHDRSDIVSCDGAPGVLLMNQLRDGRACAGHLENDRTRHAQCRSALEPFFGQDIENGAISNFIPDNFRQGIRTTRFQNAPAGLIYPGDPGFPDGKAGMNSAVAELFARRRSVGRHR